MPFDMLPTKPFFIVGNPRSGTTLLRTLLCGHSQIFIPDETGFLAHLGKYHGRDLTKVEIKQLVLEIGEMNHEWFQLVDDFDSFYEQLPEPRLDHVLDSLYRAKIKSEHAKHWGDKGPSYVRVIPEIEKIFPNAVFIHLIRDGRDCVVSALKKWGDRYWYYDSFYLLKTWQRNVRLGQSAGAQLGPDRYLEIRYEQLVGQTELTVQRACEFIDEPFESNMLDHLETGKQISAPTGHDEVSRPVNENSIANWKSKMSEFDRKLANYLVGNELRQLGYELADLPAMSFFERVKVLALASRFQLVDSARRLLFAAGWLTMSREKARGNASRKHEKKLQ